MLLPFAWRDLDCCSSSCNVFRSLWGVDPMESVRDHYTDARGALRLMRQMGGLSAMAHGLAARSGLVEGHAVGGLALSSDHRSLLVCIRPGEWAGKTQSGYAIVKTADWGWHLA